MPTPDRPAGEWAAHAQWWNEGFTDGADAEYAEQVIPMIVDRLPTSGLAVDLGCGEGQVSRAISDCGLDVVGLDTASSLLALAHGKQPSAGLVEASVTAVPLRSGSARVAISCLVLEHVVELEDAVAEAARVLEPGGELLMFLNHPLLACPESGWVDDHLVDPPEQYWRVGPYLPEDSSVVTIGAGVEITFHHRPLSRYLNTAIGAGLDLIEAVEPAPPPGFLADTPQYPLAATMPRLMMLRFRRR